MSKKNSKELKHLKLKKGEIDWHLKYNEMLEEFNTKIKNKIYVSKEPPDDKNSIWIKLSK